ncbi:MAG: DNA repair protein RecN, partial [Coprobacillus sp.]
FKVSFKRIELNKFGIDDISFMVSINKGQDLTMLNESASGGEISRIMLAIKTIILQYGNIDTIIFDEVDTGVSGKVASSIGEKMLALSKNKQVICITHLPQVASLATHHFNIEKEMKDDETITSIRLLNKDERVNEIAKMLSGEIITKEAIENAKQLLNV